MKNFVLIILFLNLLGENADGTTLVGRLKEFKHCVLSIVGLKNIPVSLSEDPKRQELEPTELTIAFDVAATPRLNELLKLEMNIAQFKAKVRAKNDAPPNFISYLEAAGFPIDKIQKLDEIEGAGYHLLSEEIVSTQSGIVIQVRPRDGPFQQDPDTLAFSGVDKYERPYIRFRTLQLVPGELFDDPRTCCTDQNLSQIFLHEYIHGLQPLGSPWAAYIYKVKVAFLKLKNDQSVLKNARDKILTDPRFQAATLLNEIQAHAHAFISKETQQVFAKIWSDLLDELMKPSPSPSVLKNILMTGQKEHQLKQYSVHGEDVLEAAINWLSILKSPPSL